MALAAEHARGTSWEAIGEHARRQQAVRAVDASDVDVDVDIAELEGELLVDELRERVLIPVRDG